MKGASIILLCLTIAVLLLGRASLGSATRTEALLEDETTRAIHIEHAGARVYWRGDQLEIHASDIARTHEAKPGLHLHISAPNVTVLLETGVVLVGKDSAKPAISATAAATGLRILGSTDGALPIIQGYAGAIHGPDADGVVVSRLSVDHCDGPGIVLGNDAIVNDLRLHRVSGDGVTLGRLSQADRVVVRNARGRGISLGERGHVGSSSVSGHASEGIVVGAGGTVIESRASNGGSGIVLGRGSLARSVVAVSNVSDGITTSYSCLVTASIAEMNGGSGIVVDDGSVVESSVANDNGDAGIVSGKGCILRGLTARTNVHTGFLVGAGSRLIDSTASNGFVGVRVRSSDVVLDGVTSHGNAYGVSAPTLLESGIQLRQNSEGAYLPERSM